MANNKSPISLLQEILIKQGYYPVYDYIGARNNGAYNQFIYRVECKKFSAEGVGNTKKSAKQNAAQNMLSLLYEKNEISVLSPDANKTQAISILTNIHEPTTKIQSSPNPVNYVGLLQEFCAQQKLADEGILYKVIDESGPSHMKIFVIEVSIGSIREQGSGQCKMIAKQDAAKKLLQRLYPDMNKLLEKTQNKVGCRKVLEDTIRKLGIEISQCVISKPILPVANPSKKAQTLYMKCTNKEFKVTRQDFLLKDLHNLFEKIYSSKISYKMKKKMQAIQDIHHANIKEVVKDIVTTLEIKIEKAILFSSTEKCVISLRLSSRPTITEFGMGKTKDKAEIQAMYNVIVTILTLLHPY